MTGDVVVPHDGRQAVGGEGAGIRPMHRRRDASGCRRLGRYEPRRRTGAGRLGGCGARPRSGQPFDTDLDGAVTPPPDPEEHDRDRDHATRRLADKPLRRTAGSGHGIYEIPIRSTSSPSRNHIRSYAFLGCQHRGAFALDPLADFDSIGVTMVCAVLQRLGPARRGQTSGTAVDPGPVPGPRSIIPTRPAACAGNSTLTPAAPADGTALANCSHSYAWSC